LNICYSLFLAVDRINSQETGTNRGLLSELGVDYSRRPLSNIKTGAGEAPKMSETKSEIVVYQGPATLPFAAPVRPIAGPVLRSRGLPG